MVVGVEVVVEMLLLVTLAGRMGMLVRIFPTVLLQVIHQTFLKDWLVSLIGISLVITWASVCWCFWGAWVIGGGSGVSDWNPWECNFFFLGPSPSPMTSCPICAWLWKYLFPLFWKPCLSFDLTKACLRLLAWLGIRKSCEKGKATTAHFWELTVADWLKRCLRHQIKPQSPTENSFPRRRRPVQNKLKRARRVNFGMDSHFQRLIGSNGSDTKSNLPLNNLWLY